MIGRTLGRRWYGSRGYNRGVLRPFGTERRGQNNHPAHDLWRHASDKRYDPRLWHGYQPLRASRSRTPRSDLAAKRFDRSAFAEREPAGFWPVLPAAGAET